MRRYLLFIILIFSLFIFGCLSNSVGNEEVSPKAELLNLSVRYISGCGGDYEGDHLYIDQYSKKRLIRGYVIYRYVMCGNFTYHTKVNGSSIDVFIDNIGEECKCLANVNISFLFRYNDTVDKIRIYGIKYKNIRGYEPISFIGASR